MVKKQNSSHTRGFTLVELVVVFSFMAVVTSFGIASFVSYSRSQAVTSSANDVESMLVLAKSRSLYQVTDPCRTLDISLDGYELTLCYSGACVGSLRTEQDFEVHAVCGVRNKVLVESKRLPSQITFDQAKTTQTSYFFPILTGGVSSAGRISVNGYTLSKEIQIDSTGNIQILL